MFINKTWVDPITVGGITHVPTASHVPTAMDMGRTVRGGLAHKIRAYGAQLVLDSVHRKAIRRHLDDK